MSTKRNKYKETLAYLYSQLPMYQRQGKSAFKKDLTNILKLCKHLKQPQNNYPTIHIAGTNGKGSTAHLLASTLIAAGKKVGIYTSPHYKDFRERIKINGQVMSKAYFFDFVKQHRSTFEKIQPSFFEITVAMAFDYFAKEQVDIAIIETGLGGRLDSTNVIQPLLSIITNISLDHQNMLGDTIELIAGEKAGIIKQDTPVVIGERQTKTTKIFKSKAKLMKAPISFASNNFEVKSNKENFSHTQFEVLENGELLFPNLKVNLHGPFQGKNIATVLQAIKILNKKETVQIKVAAIKNGFYNLKSLTNYIGRWQLLQKTPMILTDSAHNEGGLKIVMQRLSQMKYDQLHFVLGTVNDKDIGKILKLLPKNARYYFAKANIPRGMDAKLLQEQANQHGLEGRTYTSVKNALRAAKRAATKKDLIYVGGSTFVVAEVL